MKKAIKQYINCFENLTPESINKLINCVTKDFLFIDPFNKIKGRQHLKKLLESMFKKLRNPKFKVIHIAETNAVTFLKWNFSCKIFKKKIEFTGVSEITVKKNLIHKHIDYWDTGKNLYSNLPIIGWLFRNIHN
tara:strand:+ start:259 stop:660 length:402 start_codon:yes stop_codon:yes gene_type:complete